MAGAYAYTPAIWPPLAGAVIVTALALYAWRRRRDVPAARPLAVGWLFRVLWLVGIALEAAAVDPGTKIFWYKFQAVWQLPAVTAGLCFVLEYAFPGRFLTRRNLILLSIPILLDISLNLFGGPQVGWRQLYVGPDGNVVGVTAPTGFVTTAYGLGLLLVNIAVLVWLFVRSPQHRWPVGIILATQIATRALYVVDTARLPLAVPLDADVLAAIIGATGYAIALFGFRFLDPVPAARSTALEEMRDGMVVFDPHWRVVSMNRAAAGMTGSSARGSRGKLAADILPALGDLAGRLAAAPGASFDITLGSGTSARSYEADLSQLRDFRDLAVGYLLLLRDVTERRRAEAQILEQQRALAMLREREQLARELHDGIGQVMGYANLQLESVQGLIEDGEAALLSGQPAAAGASLAEAANQVTRLSSVVEDAHADVREHILNLRVAPTAQRPFLATLRQYLDGFSQNYGIPAELSVEPEIEVQKLELELQLHLFRIIQEALSNARQHAGATCVHVSFERRGRRLCARVRDDGRGFDPAQAAGDGTGHLGLRIMRERAEQIGANLAVESAPGAGTCVTVDLPLPGNGSESGDADPDRR
jgi:signal transduction histidine kinase